jgi:4-coumarate--CoA ligase
VCGASPAYNVEEMSFALKTADAKFLFTVPDSMDVAIAAAANAGIPPRHVFLLEGKVEGFTTIQHLIAVGKSYGQYGQSLPYSIPKDQKNGDVCGFLCFSSGTTGLPKAVSSQFASIS